MDQILLIKKSLMICLITQLTAENWEYKEIYVAYSDVNKYGIVKNNVADAEDGEEGSPDIEGLRPAKFKDLFLATSEKEGDSWVELKTVNWRNVPDKTL